MAHSCWPFAKGGRPGHSIHWKTGAFILSVLMVASALVRPAIAQPFIGQVVLFTGNFAPLGWVDCDGSLLPISSYETLFSLIGTTYGGDGQTTFAVPDLRGRAVVGRGQGPGLSNYVIGETGGTENVTLTAASMPAHTHAVNASALPGSSDNPTNKIPAVYPDGIPQYGSPATRTRNTDALGLTGGGQPHNNVKPYQVVRYIMATEGLYPIQGSPEMRPGK
jgi:microcystin-dependent protein